MRRGGRIRIAKPLLIRYQSGHGCGRARPSYSKRRELSRSGNFLLACGSLGLAIGGRTRSLRPRPRLEGEDGGIGERGSRRLGRLPGARRERFFARIDYIHDIIRVQDDLGLPLTALKRPDCMRERPRVLSVLRPAKKPLVPG